MLTVIYRRVYRFVMTDPNKRDNAYWLRRLEQDGRSDLVQKIKDGELTVYGATMEVGLRKRRSATSRSDQISYHYSRANVAEKRRFIVENWTSVARIVGELAKKQRARDEAQKLSK